ncbi:ABC transporter ATP-binding protein [Verrucomicrobiaceae bacterium N1E253]|uniref:ABC transporter ATP-binding protein n=1 Tax=Oceaniferula marina TaxID=2748318 RepID=A0A851GJL6_9BACT|nr:ABC transporter ATP-binding protein [Oceaniferula marina]NWK54364.1 ABC transporter ATP-binding protein [Oceaniferula marina]
MHAINTKEITQVFDNGNHRVTAVDKVTLQIHQGELIAITGRSGSGKSTLLYQLAGLLHPSSGTLHYGENQPYKLSTNKLNQFRAEHIGMIYPDFRLLPYLNVIENIQSPSLALNMTDDEVKQRALDLISSFSLQDRVNHLPSALSSGEQQRVALARALFTSPSTIIADEPTGNLDEANSHKLISTLKNYAEQGNVVIIATHDPLVMKAADRQLQMKQGQLSQALT